MINIKELRIGNLVLDLNDRVCVVNSINDNGTCRVSALDKGYSYESTNADELKPMPITRKELLNFGFKNEWDSAYNVKFANRNHYEIGYDWNKERDWKFRFYGQYLDCANIHTLQNLFFLLTGDELPTNEIV